jgi:hypothetical protein
MDSIKTRNLVVVLAAFFAGWSVAALAQEADKPQDVQPWTDAGIEAAIQHGCQRKTCRLTSTGPSATAP